MANPRFARFSLLSRVSSSSELRSLRNSHRNRAPSVARPLPATPPKAQPPPACILSAKEDPAKFYCALCKNDSPLARWQPHVGTKSHRALAGQQVEAFDAHAALTAAVDRQYQTAIDVELVSSKVIRRPARIPTWNAPDSHFDVDVGFESLPALSEATLAAAETWASVAQPESAAQYRTRLDEALAQMMVDTSWLDAEGDVADDAGVGDGLCSAVAQDQHSARSQVLSGTAITRTVMKIPMVTERQIQLRGHRIRTKQ